MSPIDPAITPAVVIHICIDARSAPFALPTGAGGGGALAAASAEGVLWPRPICGSESLLAHAVGIANDLAAAAREKSFGSGPVVSLISDSTDCLDAAKRLGLEAFRVMPSPMFESPLPAWPEVAVSESSAVGPSVQLLFQLRAPLLRAGDLVELASACASGPHSLAEVAVRASRHPVSAFMPRKGHMDFSLTADHAEWRRLDDAAVWHFPCVARARRVSSGEMKTGLGESAVFLAGDAVTCMRVFGELELFAAGRLLERGEHHGRPAWKPL